MLNIKQSENSRRASNKKRAFTLVEALVAISILMIAIASPMTLAQKGLSTATLSKDQMIAAFLAQDAIEAVKNIRDTIAISQTSGDWLDRNATLSLTPCICVGEECNFDSTIVPAKICSVDTSASQWNSTYIKSVNNINLSKIKISYNVDINGIKQFTKYDYTGANCDNNSPYVCDSKFSRYINIEKDPTGKNTNEAVVSVRVFWDSPLGLQKIDIQDFIYNYSENF